MTTAIRSARIQQRSTISWLSSGFDLILLTKRGNWLNFLAAIECGLEYRGRFVTCEDDVIVCRHTADVVTNLQWPSERCGCIQLYTAAGYGDLPNGLSVLPTEKALDMLGACALLWHPKAAKDVLEFGRRNGWRGDTYGPIVAPEEKKAADTFAGEVLTFCGWEVWVHNPSLAQHIGDDDSTLGHGQAPTPRRTALNFPGEETDARKVFANANRCTLQDV